MAVNLQQQLESVGVKMRLVAEKYRTLSAVKSDLESDNVRLRAEIISRDREIEQLRAKLEYQQVATTITPSRQELEQTRAIVADLVRDIDRCIAELME